MNVNNILPMTKNIFLLLTILLSYHAFAWDDCPEIAITEAYINSDAVALIDIENYRIKKDSLLFECKVIESFKGEMNTDIALYFTQIEPFELNSVFIKHTNKILKKRYIVYLKHIQKEKWGLINCRMLAEINNLRNSKREIAILKRLKENDFNGLWIKNNNVLDKNKAAAINLDSLVKTINQPVNLNGYPVRVFHILIGKDEKNHGIYSASKFQLKISQWNELIFNPISKSTNRDEIESFFLNLTKQIKWKASQYHSYKINNLVTLRWEILSNGTINVIFL